uniref:ATP-dependent DNA helicase n=1 Tax=Lactuca sativa TaxID=4236 RepID=A0A9R1WR06_LACSA|nr:hypothetical protein LSAT_V11C100039970 [Lactuca sativa]
MTCQEQPDSLLVSLKSRLFAHNLVEEALAYPSYSMHLFSTQKIEKDTIETIMHEKKEKNKMRRIANEIAVGQHAGKRVFLPRIPLCPSDDEMFPFKLKRMQFPVQHSFSMTINKAQGQTIPNVGVYLLIWPALCGVVQRNITCQYQGLANEAT